MTIPTQLVERLRDVHASMVDAVLGGDRMREVAAIAARRIGRPVAVIIPALGHELVEPEGDLTGLRAYVEKGGERPAGVAREVVVRNGGTPIGAILLLTDSDPDDIAEADAVLHLAAMAAMTDLALVESRQQVEDELRGTFLEELRAGERLDAAEVIRRGERFGCDLAHGALILAGDPQPDRIHRFMAAVKAECPGAFVQCLDGRVYAVLPAGDEADAQDRAVASASVLAKRLQAHAPVGLSAFQRNASELGRAIEEADLVVNVLGNSDLSADSLADGTYRLLVRLLASDPDQLARVLRGERRPARPLRRAVPHRPDRHARRLPRPRRQARRRGRRALRPPPHRGLPARAHQGAHDARPGALRRSRAAQPRAEDPPAHEPALAVGQPNPRKRRSRSPAPSSASIASLTRSTSVGRHVSDVNRSAAGR